MNTAFDSIKRGLLQAIRHAESAAKMQSLSQPKTLYARQAMAAELSRNSENMPMGESVIEQMRKESRY